MNEEGLLNATEMKNLFACRIKETVSLNERYGLISKVRMLEMTESFTHLAVSVNVLVIVWRCLVLTVRCCEPA